MLSFLLATIFMFSFVSGTSYSSPTVKKLATFADFTENIAVRANGWLLLSQIGHATVHTLDPASSDTSPSLLYTFPNATGVTGMAEIAPDLFAVAVGQWNVSTANATKGSLAMWTLDLRHSEPKAKKIVTVKESVALNGVTYAPGIPHVVFVAESYAGYIYRIDLAKGKYKVMASSPYFLPAENGPETMNIGINGMRYYDEHIYFTNSYRGLFGRVPISKTGYQAGDVEVIADLPTGNDDFAIGADGRAWITVHPSSILVVDQQGNVSVALNGTEVPDPTSAAFGRGRHDNKTLYVTVDEIGSTGITGGVIAVDLKDM
ncbi:hypothetical protein EJ04DRAFT_571572 [Polyplosphaeria fusca]|uniref:SMP-30/Gluconolactonase/LRE-like region domain-containing protein n=1 Tax=Polyplosphaeria fusca TaxID=682080 RepID=A0A9P4RC92_9PLEO|nr:hypothetical protein EJ04DRAFT_571572 [Polyplosphaeria fusca]